MECSAIVTPQEDELVRSDMSLPNLGHLKAITTEHGIWQHCIMNEPNQAHGFSIDDQARGLIVGLGLVRHGIDPVFAEQLVDTCFRYIEAASLPNGRYHNWADERGQWLDRDGSDDCLGRTIWALGVAWSANHLSAPRSRISVLLDRTLPRVSSIKPPRAMAYCILGVSHLGQKHSPVISELASRLMDALWTHSVTNWYWFEELMTYCNGRLPQSLLIASQALPERVEFRKAGLKSLDFLLQSMRKAAGGKGYAPIGNQGWYRKGALLPASFDQQPVDAGVLAEACIDAARLSSLPKYQIAATDAMSWYDGNNAQGRPMVDPHTGGVYDGLCAAGVNRNMGAESVVSHLMAVLAMRDYDTGTDRFAG